MGRGLQGRTPPREASPKSWRHKIGGFQCGKAGGRAGPGRVGPERSDSSYKLNNARFAPKRILATKRPPRAPFGLIIRQKKILGVLGGCPVRLSHSRGLVPSIIGRKLPNPFSNKYKNTWRVREGDPPSWAKPSFQKVQKSAKTQSPFRETPIKGMPGHDQPCKA